MRGLAVPGVVPGAAGGGEDVAGRREVPVDPAEGPVERFACELRKLRAKAGGITYRTLVKQAGYSVTTLSQAAAGEQLPTLPVVLAYVEACGGETAWWEARWRQAVEEAAGAGAEDGDTAAESPYRGLARFETGDSGRFFGREQLTADLLDLLRRRRFAAVFGPSGNGKSSLLRAGLIPALQHTQERALRPAAIRILTPGERPARTHAPLLTPTDPGSGGADTFVIVDQFEEVFTLCHDAAERTRFIDLLLTARESESRLRVLLAVRGDFYGRCADHRGLADALRDANLLVGAMSRAELRDAVVKPAAAAGLTVERTLTARLVNEVADAPGGLPLLSHVLMETWRRRRSKTLTLAGYEAAGALGGAIAKTAEDVYNRFTQQEAAAARRILLRLVAPGEGTLDTRRPAQRTEVETIGRPETAQALEALVRARLLTFDDDAVEIAHETLLTAWPRLRGWIEDDRERLRAHRKLTEAAHTWRDLGRERDALYRGSRLATARDHFGAPHRDDLTELEHAFLTASSAAHEQALRAAARITRRLRALTATLSVLLVLAVIASLIAYQQQQAADAAQQVALSRQLAAQSAALTGTDPDLAALMAVHAYRMSPTSQAVESLYTAAAMPLEETFRRLYRTPVATVVFSPDGDTVATSDVDGEVSLWDTGSGRLRSKLPAHNESVNVMAFSQDGRTLAVTDRGTVRLWDTDSGRHHTSLRLRATVAGAESDVSVFSMALSPDGRTLATGNTDGTVRMWNTQTGRHHTTLPRQTGPGVFVAFSPDGHALATTSFDGAVRLWNADTGRLRRSLPGHTGPVNAVAFSPDSRTLALATTGRDSAMQLWDADTGRLRRSLPGRATSVVFSPDGRTLATTSGDRTVRLWDADTGRLRRSLPGHSSMVIAVVFSPDSRTLTSSSDDGTLRMFDVTVNPRAIHTGRLKDAESMAISQDSRVLATTSKNGAVRLWDAGSGRLRATLPQHMNAVNSLALTTDGRTLAINDTSGIGLWDTATGRLLKSMPADNSDATSMTFNQKGDALATIGLTRGTELWNTATGRLLKHLAIERRTELSGFLLAFSPDGRTLAVGGAKGQVRLYDTATGRLRKSLTGQTAPLTSVAFSPDGRTMAAGGGNSTVTMWDGTSTSSHRFLRSLPETTGAMAFSPDGRTLATASTNNQVQLWDMATGGTLATLSGHTDTVHSIAWSRDGRTLTTGSTDQAVRVWNAVLPTPATAINKICHAIGRDLSVIERSRYLPDQEAAQDPKTGCHPDTGG
ncbi:nSTAND1 domain-containing NTPase [Streptomyces umbrinus]|uniref:nSTAND1 domain-containing NTPase n=1 Tax=Streptomyces umbrinus TaxID=67370 RepID=UPI00341BEF9C